MTSAVRIRTIILSRCLARVHRFNRDLSGVAAVEAALFLPIAIAFFGLLVFGAQGLSIQRKVTITAHTITDLVTQQSSPLNKSTLDCLLDVASSVLSPYNTSTMTIVVSEVQVTGSGTTGTVVWSEAMQGHGTALGTGATVTLPSVIAPAGSYLIVGQVRYTYDPFEIGQKLWPTTLHDEIYLSPRLSRSITENPNG